VSYRFLEDIAIADIAFETTGETLDELFKSAALALEEVQVDTKAIETSKSKQVRLRSETLDGLLFDFLNELIFLKDAESLVFSKFKIEIDKNSEYKLKAEMGGEELNPEKHELRTDVKAVTKHLFGIKEEKDGYKATVVLDV